MYVTSFIRIERGSDGGAHDFKYNKVPLFARKPGNINTSMYAAPKLALVPASRYYCDVNRSYHNACAKFDRGLDGGPNFKLNKKNREYQYFDVCSPETSSCASKLLILRCKLVKPQCLFQVSLGLKEVLMGPQ